MLSRSTPLAADHVIFYCLLVLIAWLPLPFGSHRPWAWSLLEVGVLLLAIMWLIQFARSRVCLTTAFIRAWPVHLLLILWLGFIALQLFPLPEFFIEILSPHVLEIRQTLSIDSQATTISLNTYATQVGLLKGTVYVLVFCLSLLLVRTRQRVLMLATVIIVSGLFQALFGTFMALSGLKYGFFIEGTNSIGNVSGTFINRNHLAAFLNMSIAIGIGVMIAHFDTNTYETTKKKLVKWLKLLLSYKLRLRLYLIIMVVALVMTHSRMGNSAFFISLTVTGSLFLLLTRQAKRNIILFLVSIVLIDVFIIGSYFGFEQVVERVEQTRLETEQRDNLYPYALDYWGDFALTGSGLGTFYSVMPAYRQSDIAGFFRHAENDYLQFLAEVGLLGTGLLGLSVLISLVKALQAMKKRRNPFYKGLAFSVVMAMLALLIHASVEFNFQIPANSVYFCIYLALAWSALHMKSTMQTTSG